VGHKNRLLWVAKATIGGIVGAFLGLYAEGYYLLFFTGVPLDKLPTPVVTPVVAGAVGAVVAVAVECYLPHGRARQILAGMLYGAIGGVFATQVPFGAVSFWQASYRGIKVVTETDRVACGRIGLALFIVCVTVGGVLGRAGLQGKTRAR
jgi:hypothetical protein